MTFRSLCCMLFFWTPFAYCAQNISEEKFLNIERGLIVCSLSYYRNTEINSYLTCNDNYLNQYANLVEAVKESSGYNQPEKWEELNRDHIKLYEHCVKFTKESSVNLLLPESITNCKHMYYKNLLLKLLIKDR